MNLPPDSLLGLAVALGIGLLIGAERERKKTTGPSRSAAGVRTFALATVGGALSLILGRELLLIALVVGAFAFSTVSYLRTQKSDPGLTSEFALVVAVLIGALAVRHPALAAGLGVMTTLLLASRNALHRWLRELLSEQEAHDALLFLAATLIVLPLTPNRTLGPLGILQPRRLWELVVLILGMSGLGHIAMRALGSRYGLPVAGLLGGFVSATATIGSMGAKARVNPKILRSALTGALLASVATVVQLGIVVFVSSRSAFYPLVWPLAFATVGAVGTALIYALKTVASSETQVKSPGRAFDLKSALGFAALTTAVVFLSGILNQRFGGPGLLAGAVLAGCADAHAAAISVANLVAQGEVPPEMATLPILGGLTANTIVKAIAAFALGGRKFAWKLLPGQLAFGLLPWVGLMLRNRLNQP